MTKEELHDLTQRLQLIRNQVKSGQFDRQKAIELPITQEYKKAFDKKAREIAKKYNMSPKLFNPKKFFS